MSQQDSRAHRRIPPARTAATALVFVVFVVSCMSLLSVVSLFRVSHSKRIVHLVILHTNDMHGQAQPLGSKGEPSGGFAALAGAIVRERESAARAGFECLLVDAGDLWVGPPEGTRTEGEFVARVMNSLEYDAAVVGNHEFDHGPEVTSRLQRWARFPILGANVRETATGKRPTWLAATTHVRRGGLDVRIIGVVTSHIREVTTPAATKGLEVDPEEEALERELSMGPGGDLTVLLTHCGHEVDRSLAERFHGRVAAIVGGHSHHEIPHAWHVPEGAPDAVLVGQTGAKTKNLGRMDLVIDRSERRVISSEGRLIAVRPGDGEDRAVRALVDVETALVDKAFGNVVGELATPLTVRPGACSSSLGNLVTDVMREASSADIAFTNKAGLRANLPAGTLQLRNLFEVDPFGNTVVTMDLSGGELQELVENMIATMPLDVSGLGVLFDPSRPGGHRVVSLSVAGHPVDLARDYRVATNSFLASGGDGHKVFARGRARRDEGIPVRDLMRRFFESKKPFSPGPLEERVAAVSSGR